MNSGTDGFNRCPAAGLCRVDSAGCRLVTCLGHPTNEHPLVACISCCMPWPTAAAQCPNTESRVSAGLSTTFRATCLVKTKYVSVSSLYLVADQRIEILNVYIHLLGSKMQTLLYDQSCGVGVKTHLWSVDGYILLVHGYLVKDDL